MALSGPPIGCLPTDALLRATCCGAGHADPLPERPILRLADALLPKLRAAVQREVGRRIDRDRACLRLLGRDDEENHRRHRRADEQKRSGGDLPSASEREAEQRDGDHEGSSHVRDEQSGTENRDHDPVPRLEARGDDHDREREQEERRVDESVVEGPEAAEMPTDRSQFLRRR